MIVEMNLKSKIHIAIRYLATSVITDIDTILATNKKDYTHTHTHTHTQSQHCGQEHWSQHCPPPPRQFFKILSS